MMVFTPGRVALAGVLCTMLAASSHAQTDYYNTDRGRPLQTEDAYPVERRAFELQAAPLRVERAPGGAYLWSIEPEIAYGILPRTHVELGAPMHLDGAGEGFRVVGLHLSALHNLNVETAIPAFALAASVMQPVESGAGGAHVAARAIATRTFTWARMHLNADYDFDAGSQADAGRWSLGLAVDRTLPLRSLLMGAELVVSQPPLDGAPLVYEAGAGVRYQLAPRWAIDTGIGHRLTGDDRSWYLTFGSAYAFGLPWNRGGLR